MINVEKELLFQFAALGINYTGPSLLTIKRLPILRAEITLFWNSSRQLSSIIETKHWQVQRFAGQVKGAKTNSRRARFSPRVVYKHHLVAIHLQYPTAALAASFIFNTPLSLTLRIHKHFYLAAVQHGFRLFCAAPAVGRLRSIKFSLKFWQRRWGNGEHKENDASQMTIEWTRRRSQNSILHHYNAIVNAPIELFRNWQSDIFALICI
jgi:hypothetical protein